MSGKHFFRQALVLLRAARPGFRSIPHTSQLRLYGEYRYSEDHGHHWKQGRIATAHRVGHEAPVVRVREIYTDPQAVRHLQDLVVTQEDLETGWVIIKPLTLLQRLRFLDRRRVTDIAALWLDDIYRVYVKGTKQCRVGIVLCISRYGDQWGIMKDVDDPRQSQFHFTQQDLETGRVVLRPRTIRERLKRRPVEQRRRVLWPPEPGRLWVPLELPEREDLE